MFLHIFNLHLANVVQAGKVRYVFKIRTIIQQNLYNNRFPPSDESHLALKGREGDNVLDVLEDGVNTLAELSHVVRGKA